jgi:hypothetical protein
MIPPIKHVEEVDSMFENMNYAQQAWLFRTYKFPCIDGNINSPIKKGTNLVSQYKHFAYETSSWNSIAPTIF